MVTHLNVIIGISILHTDILYTLINFIEVSILTVEVNKLLDSTGYFKNYKFD